MIEIVSMKNTCAALCIYIFMTNHIIFIQERLFSICCAKFHLLSCIFVYVLRFPSSSSLIAVSEDSGHMKSAASFRMSSSTRSLPDIQSSFRSLGSLRMHSLGRTQSDRKQDAAPESTTNTPTQYRAADTTIVEMV